MNDYVNQFLQFGYVFQKTPSIPEYLKVFDFNETLKNRNSDEILKIGLDCWRNAIENTLINETKEIVVPISGGFDSRAILAGLLEFLPAKDIHTYTYGIPNTWDYEIGNKIAKIIGTNHHCLNLETYEYDLDSVRDIGRRVDFNSILFFHPPIHWISNEIGKDKSYWTGYMGDPITGSHIADRKLSWDESILKFIQKNRELSKGLEPLYCQTDPRKWFPNGPWIDNIPVSFYEQIDFVIRQEQFIKPLVLLKGLSYRTPFIDQANVNFFLSLPEYLRREQRMYKRIIFNLNPALFSLPTKNLNGLGLNSPLIQREFHKRKSVLLNLLKSRIPKIKPLSKNLNYVNFCELLRTDNSLQSITFEKIQELKYRQLFDPAYIDRLWVFHQDRRSDYSNELLILASLEINLSEKNKL